MLEHSNVEQKFHKAAKGKTERPDVAVILEPTNIQRHVKNVVEQLENTAPEGYDIPHPEKAWKPSRHRGGILWRWCRMSPLEIISRLCDVTETLSAIVKKQQTIIEQSKIEEAVRVELRQEVEETDREMDVLEYHMRKYCDTDDLEATEFGKENAVDD